MKAIRLLLFLSFYCRIFTGYAQTTEPFPTEGIEPWYDLQLTSRERDSLLDGLKEKLKDYLAIHQDGVNYATPPGLLFNPVPLGWVAGVGPASREGGVRVGV
jgi:hypothetical protein